MKTKTLLFAFALICLFFAQPVYSQSRDTLTLKKKDLLASVDSLKRLFSIADTIRHSYGENDTTDHVGNLNISIAETLTAILKNPDLISHDLDSLLGQIINITQSADKKIALFSWYENTGGTFKSVSTIVYYKLSLGKTGIAYDGSDGSSSLISSYSNLFCSTGASFYEIYKLRSKTKDLYLCIGSGRGCTTCIFNTATVIELKRNSANFNYQAFNPPPDEVHSYREDDLSCLSLGARDGNIEKFEFNPKNQTLTIAYLTDDNTPIKSEEDEKQRRIVRKFVFNGEKFIGSIFH